MYDGCFVSFFLSFFCVRSGVLSFRQVIRGAICGCLFCWITFEKGRSNFVVVIETCRFKRDMYDMMQ